MSEDGELFCPDCLSGVLRREIDADAMDMAAETLGFQVRERVGRFSHEPSLW